MIHKLKNVNVYNFSDAFFQTKKKYVKKKERDNKGEDTIRSNLHYFFCLLFTYTHTYIHSRVVKKYKDNNRTYHTLFFFFYSTTSDESKIWRRNEHGSVRRGAPKPYDDGRW